MIQSIEIENFKSIRKQRVELGNLNILIGPNGAGKSNFISLFRFLKHLSEQELEEYIYQSGGINLFLFKGFEESNFIKGELLFMGKPDSEKRPLFGFKIISDGESFQFDTETASYSKYYANDVRVAWALQVDGRKESALKEKANSSTDGKEKADTRIVYDNLKDIRIYHFHDTSDNAQIKLPQDIEDVYHFKAEGENLAPFLLLLKEQYFDAYLKIVETVRLVYPFFHDFVLEESPRAKGKVVLRWKEKGNGITYTARQVSDGTLRFVCLATLLIQPAGTAYVPRTVILDEPELGLHPFAIHVLAELIQKAAQEKQIIVATQSVSLINYFTPKDLLITERTPEGATEFRRPKDEDFAAWLDDYSLGQLWESNVFGGRP
ncbi:MAG: AAA family ATPase [Saprospiraceae bacterium]|nr:AAA family ATPase [Saprospiraceae bacterium]